MSWGKQFWGVSETGLGFRIGSSAEVLIQQTQTRTHTQAHTHTHARTLHLTREEIKACLFALVMRFGGEDPGDGPRDCLGAWQTLSWAPVGDHGPRCDRARVLDASPSQGLCKVGQTVPWGGDGAGAPQGQIRSTDRSRAQMPAQAGRACVTTSCPRSGLLLPDTTRAHHQEGGRRGRPGVALPRSGRLGVTAHSPPGRA